MTIETCRYGKPESSRAKELYSCTSPRECAESINFGCGPYCIRGFKKVLQQPR